MNSCDNFALAIKALSNLHLEFGLGFVAPFVALWRNSLVIAAQCIYACNEAEVCSRCSMVVLPVGPARPCGLQVLVVAPMQLLVLAVRVPCFQTLGPGLVFTMLACDACPCGSCVCAIRVRACTVSVCSARACCASACNAWACWRSTFVFNTSSVCACSSAGAVFVLVFFCVLCFCLQCCCFHCLRGYCVCVCSSCY